MGNAVKAAGGYVLKKALGWLSGRINKAAGGGAFSTEKIAGNAHSDVTYQLVISPQDAVRGAVVEVGLPHMPDVHRVSVRIPAGVKTGTRLRLKEMGHALAKGMGRRGDLYLELKVM